jgi:hypothetical protein
MKTKNILIYLLAATFVGCVPSLHPLFSNKDAITKDTLIGIWTSEDDKDTWQLRQSCDENDKRYRLIQTHEGGNPGRFHVTFGKLNGMLFIDLFPDFMEPNTSPFYQFHQVPAHTFAKIEQTSDGLKIKIMDSGAIEKLLLNNPILIKHEVIKDQKDSKIVLTASTEELQKFVAKYANDPNIFSRETILKRKTVSEPNDPNSTSQKKN